MKSSTLFRCSSCQAETPKWSGQCAACGEWNTLEEGQSVKIKGQKSSKGISTQEVQMLSMGVDQKYSRIPSGLSEIDRVLAGGFLSDAAVLIGGEPGIGKSTLLLQVAHTVVKSGMKLLYISGEESLSQVSARYGRLQEKERGEIHFLNEYGLEEIIATIETSRPHVVIIDSIQTISSVEIAGTMGSPSQVRHGVEVLTSLAKRMGFLVLLVGHVTKDGQVAGPKAVEHIVDVVLYLEGERSGNMRILRSLKNRFGPVDELGVLEMTEKGFQDLKNPSEYLLRERNTEGFGSVLTCCIEGSRAFLMEVQVLTSSTNFGYPKRSSNGFPTNRLDILLAVAQKYLGLKLDDVDVYVNVVGGMNVKDRAMDLAVMVALISSYQKKSLPPYLVVWGEVGLTGEIRSVNLSTKRMKESDVIENVQRIIPKNTDAGVKKGGDGFRHIREVMGEM